MTTHRGAIGCPLVPRAATLPDPPQNLQMSAYGGIVTSGRAPRAPILPRPLQHLQVPALSQDGTNTQVPRVPWAPFSLAQDNRATDRILNGISIDPAHGSPDASTAALGPRPTRASIARSVGSFSHGLSDVREPLFEYRRSAIENC
eukprot:CAMPEP_0197599410 /NCGR_PEP_ID=MMETSP1326-20131121/31314_1 /TAXON_ID=1155430 /ORGANISM="Genus nov. species nov., Strain RCC2288" /LENGTH=145 /DNA_ID=CAMNT_0043166373 /DNA_START=801 /DNA_END=1239 /DNA_ORIENTATION=-